MKKIDIQACAMSTQKHKENVIGFTKTIVLVCLVFAAASCDDNDTAKSGTEPVGTKPKASITDITGILDALTWNQPDSTLIFEKVSDGVKAVFTISASTLAKGDALEVIRDLGAKENIDRLGGATSRTIYLKDSNKEIGFSIPGSAIAKSSDGTSFVQKALFSGTVRNIFSKTSLDRIEEFTDVFDNEQVTWKYTGQTLTKDGKGYLVGKTALPSL